MKLLLLFDIDGTILRFRHDFARQLFAELVRDVFGKEIPLSQMPDFAGMTDLQIFRETAAVIGIDNYMLNDMLPGIWEKMQASFEGYCTPENIDLIPGALEIIKTLYDDDRYQLGLLTGNFRANAYMKLKTYNLDSYFPFGAFGCENGNRNELPELAISRANTFAGDNIYSRRNTIIIGDTPRDIECAKSNGIPVISISGGIYTAVQLSIYNPDALITGYNEFLPALEILSKDLIL